jgi:hypothetical protein
MNVGIIITTRGTISNFRGISRHRHRRQQVLPAVKTGMIQNLTKKNRRQQVLPAAQRAKYYCRSCSVEEGNNIVPLLASLNSSQYHHLLVPEQQ